MGTNWLLAPRGYASTFFPHNRDTADTSIIDNGDFQKNMIKLYARIKVLLLES